MLNIVFFPFFFFTISTIHIFLLFYFLFFFSASNYQNIFFLLCIIIFMRFFYIFVSFILPFFFLCDYRNICLSLIPRIIIIIHIKFLLFKDFFLFSFFFCATNFHIIRLFEKKIRPWKTIVWIKEYKMKLRNIAETPEKYW